MRSWCPHRKAFKDWLAVNGARFTHGLEWHRSTSWSPDAGPVVDPEFTFAGIHPVLRGALTYTGICIAVEYEDDVWDMIFDDDCYPLRVPGGYICKLSEPEFHKVYPDRIAMWTEHLFEGLLWWVNERLAKSNWLVIEGGRGWRNARLAIERPPPTADPRTHDVYLVMPLRT